MEEQNKVPEKTKKLPKWLTTVTPLSATLALILFVSLPIAGFYFGTKYQDMNLIQPPTSSVSPARASSNPQLANPASIYCKEQGGESKIITAPDGSQSGQCVFSDGRKCDEWQFFRTKICK